MEEAIAECDEAIPINPRDFHAHYNRGMANRHLGQDLDNAILLNPQYAEAYYNRGNSYRILGQPQRAVE